jgi:hypothetical protein
MTLQDQMFLGYIVFLFETEKDPMRRGEKIIKGAEDYILGLEMRDRINP